MPMPVKQLQPLLGRGNLHSLLGGQFQLNRRRGVSRDRTREHNYSIGK